MHGHDLPMGVRAPAEPPYPTTAPSRRRRSRRAAAAALLMALLILLLPASVSATGSDATPTPSPTPSPYSTTLAIDCSAPSILVVDLARGGRLFERSADTAVSLPVLGKAMTALLALEAYADDTMVTISKVAAAADAGRLGLKTGEKEPLGFLVLGLMLQASDGAAIALAEQVSGEESVFVEKMNERAAALGMGSTVFANSTGRTAEGQATTVADAARFFRKAFANPAFLRIFQTRDTFYVFPDRTSHHFTNRIDSAWSFADTMKGGLRGDDGTASLAFTATDRGFTFLCVTAGDRSDRVPSDVERIAAGVFDAYESVTLVSAGQSYPVSETVAGQSVPLVFAQTVAYVRPVGVDTISGVHYESLGRTTLPVLQSQAVGKAVFDFTDGTSIAVDLFPADDVYNAASPWTRLRQVIEENQDLAAVIAVLLAFLALIALLRLLESAVRGVRQRRIAGRTRRR